jgi:protein gp37
MNAGGRPVGKTKIEWSDSVWNPVVGCSIVSPGCTNCYAMKMAARIERMSYRGEFREELGETINVGRSHYDGTTQSSKAGPVWTGKVAMAPEHILTVPLRWKRPRRIFVNSMGDLFHESVPDAWIDRVFAVMALAPQHTFQVLTKRSKRMREYLTDSKAYCRILRAADPLRVWRPALGGVSISNPADAAFWPHVWIGVSAEDQTRADERRDDLFALAGYGWKSFVSYEPALGPVDWTRWGFMDWLISGGESGRGARPSHPDWHRAARDFCADRGIAYFFKQWGEFSPDDPAPHHTAMNRVGKKAAGRLLDGVEHNEMPA